MKNREIKNHLIFMVIFFVIFFVSSNKNIFFQSSDKFLNPNEIKFIKIADKKLKTELALDSVSQERGLSGRKELSIDESMLFVFNHSGDYGFWMKDMNFPIDIIWINEDLEVVYVKEKVSPDSYPESFSSSLPAKYVLEVFASFCEKNNLKVGDHIEFLPS